MKTFKLFSMAALALTMAACSNEDNVLENVTPAQQGTMHFTATVAAPGSGATTRTTYTEITSGVDAGKIKVAWNVGDKIALVHNGVVDEAEVTKVDDVTGSATIDAPTITGKPSDNDEVKLVYPAYAVGSVSSGTSFSLAPAVFGYMRNQDGTLEFIQNKLDFRWGPSQLAVSGSDATLKTSVEMSSAIVIWKLTLTTDGSTPLSATKVTIKNGSKTQAATTTISATSEVYLALPFIGSYDNLTIEATVGSDTYAYIAPGSVSVTEGKYYQSTVTMTKPAPAARTLAEATTEDIGKVVGADGKIYANVAAAQAASTTACAIIAYVGSETAEYQTHGLAIAMKDAAEGSTVLWSSSSYDQSLTNYTDASEAVTTAQSGHSNSWSSSYSASNYPAFYDAQHNTITTSDGISAAVPASGTSSWFLPSLYQWNMIVKGLSGQSADLSNDKNDDYKASSLNTKIEAAGGTGLQPYYYWSSTEYDSNNVWGFNADDGLVDRYTKASYGFVRSAFAF